MLYPAELRTGQKRPGLLVVYFDELVVVSSEFLVASTAETRKNNKIDEPANLQIISRTCLA